MESEETVRGLQRDERALALSLLPEWNNCHEAVRYRTAISHPRDPSKHRNMGPRKLISLPKIFRRPRSKARIDPGDGPTEVDPAVGLPPTESTPDLRTGPTPEAPSLSTPDDQEPNGMQTVFYG